MLGFISEKHLIFHAFDANLVPFLLIFMFNPPFYLHFVELKKTRQKSSNLDNK